MSERTLVRRLARSRACWRVDRSRARSRLWPESFSRRRERLFCFSADEVRVASESRRRASWSMTVSRWGRTGLTPVDEAGGSARSRIPSEAAPQASSQCCAPHPWPLGGCLQPPRTESTCGRGSPSGDDVSECPRRMMPLWRTWVSNVRACCLSWAQPALPDGADIICED